MEIARKCHYVWSRSFLRVHMLCRESRRLNNTSGSNLDDVVFKEIGSSRIIELNRPKTLNALTLPMIHMIYPKMQKWELNPDVKLVIMKGAGEKAFCAGGDVRSLVEAIEVGDRSLTTAFYRDEYKLDYLIGTYDIPYVAFIDGITMGGGVGISVHGAFRVATERSLFAMPETAIGLFPDVGGGHFLPRLKGKVGLFLALTGYRLKARDLVEAGIATHYVNSKLLPTLENELLLMKPEDVKKDTVKQVLDKYHEKCAEPYTFSLWPHLNEIDEAFSGISVEEIVETLRSNGSDWAKKQVDTIETMSPTSLKITFRQLDHGAAMSLKDVLKMEYGLTQKIAEEAKDFVQGVRAVLIDKHGTPVWDPDTLAGVTDEKIDWYFEPLPQDKELNLTKT